jgi:hypothetical protein
VAPLSTLDHPKSTLRTVVRTVRMQRSANCRWSGCCAEITPLPLARYCMFAKLAQAKELFERTSRLIVWRVTCTPL